MGDRGRRGLAMAVVLSLAVLGIAGSTVGARGAEKRDRLQLPVGFVVQASNGYEITAFAQDGKAGNSSRDFVVLMVRGEYDAVSYLTSKAKVSATSIDASFGAIGSVDMDFRATGTARTQRSPCDGEPFRYDSGSFEGSFQFHGEEGFAEATATRVPGSFRFLLEALCEEGSHDLVPSKRGAELNVSTLGPPLDWPTKGRRHRVELRANKNRPTAPARFVATVEESLAGMLIARTTESWGKPGSFRFPRSLGKARVRPPAPFFGSASFLEAPVRRWRGDLRVDFPGRPGVGLTGPNVAGELIPARLIPDARPF